MSRTAVVLGLIFSHLAGADLAGREWTSANGKFKIEAELVEAKDGEAVLKKPDGSYVSVQIANLSDKDRKFIESSKEDSPKPPAVAPEPEADAPRGSIRITSLKGERPEDPPGDARRFTDVGGAVTSLAFSPDGALLAAGKKAGALNLFDVSDSDRKPFTEDLDLLDQVSACVFTPDGKRLLLGGSSGLIGIWRIGKSGDFKSEPHFSGHLEKVTSIAVSVDGKFALSGGDDKLVRYWQIESGRELAMFKGFEGKIKACHIAPDASAAFATDGHALLTINLKTKKGVPKKLTASWASGQFAAFSTDGIVAAGDIYNVRLWDLKSGKESPPLVGDDIQWSGVFTPDGTRLITGGDGKLNVWDIKTQKLISTLATKGSGHVETLAASPDNWHVAAIPGSSGRPLQVFRIPKR